MTDQGKRGGQKGTAGHAAEQGKHRGVHPGSTTQHKQSRGDIGHKPGHEELVPDKRD